MAGKAMERTEGSARAASKAAWYVRRSSSASPCAPPCHTGPTAWTTNRARRRNPGVSTACPVGQPPMRRQAAISSGPAARWMAPSTPPPPRRPLFAALTIASTSSVVMSVWITSTIAHLRSGGPGEELPLAHPIGVLSNPFPERPRLRDPPQRRPRRGPVGGDDPDRADALEPFERGLGEARVVHGAEIDLVERPSQDPLLDG